MKRYALLTLIVILHFVTDAQSSFEHLTEKGYSELIEGDITAAKQDLEKALSILPKKLPLEDKAIFFNNLGVAHYQTGEYKKGIDDYSISLGCYRKIGNDSLIAESLHNLGLAYKEIGLYERATKELLQSARTFEKNGNIKELSSAWNAIGNIQRDLGNFEKALEYHQRALRIREKINYDKGIADSYHNIGSVYFDSKQYGKAEIYLLEALRRKRLLENQSNIVNTLSLLGRLYVNKDEPKKAISYLKTAYDMRLEVGNSAKASSSIYYIGTYYATIGDQTKALELFRQAVEMAELSGDRQLLADALLGEIDILKKQKQKDPLIEKYQRLIQTRELIALDVNRKELARLEISYDVERKNREIQLGRKQAKIDRIRIDNQRLKNQQLLGWLIAFALIAFVILLAFYQLRQRKKKIEQQNRELEEQKDEIVHLHHELSHRTKNYFGLLSGILASDKAQARHTETIDVLDINIRRLEAMSMVQHYLLDDSTRQNKEVRLDAYFSKLIDLILLHLFPHGSELRFHKEIDAIYLDYDIAMRLAIVLNELLCNAIEHGLESIEEPELFVSVKQIGTRIQLRVQDNGKGIVNEPIETNTVKGHGLILKLLNKIKGTIEYRNENGCIATVEIPL